MKALKYLLMISILVLSCSNDDNDDNHSNATQFTDSRDGQTYEIVTIGTQTWFAENLNYELDNDLSLCYDNDTYNCYLFGRLYRGNDVQTVCPDGWHLPSVEEWETLINYLGGIETAHLFLAPNAVQQGTPVNFNLLAAGQKAVNYNFMGISGYYWTSTEGNDPDFHRYVKFVKDQSVTIPESALNFGYGNSCRCVKD